MENLNIYNAESRLIDGIHVYQIRLYDPRLEEYEEDVAYLKDDYYYTYKGKTDIIDYDDPGIYYDTIDNKFVLVETTDEKYKYEGKIGTVNVSEIVNMLNNNEVVIINVPESDKMTVPDLNGNDDILKRLIKRAMRNKQINLDSCKSRFADKNALFNFKQVIKGDGRLSMLLFDRGVDAFNLKYTIIVEEAEPDKLIIGVPLKEPIIATSDETFDL